MKTIMTDNVWFPPLNVAAHYEVDFAGITPPKKAEEMMATAMAVAGIQAMQKKQYWVQAVSDTEGSPDARTICCDSSVNGAAPLCYQQDVEVVTYTAHSSKESLASFVANTKLSANKAYDELTTILVNVQTNVRLPSKEDWSNILGATGKNNPVLVLGRIKKDAPEYKLAIVYPVFEGALDYNLPKLLKSLPHSKAMKWSIGTKDKQTDDDSENHCPFEKLGATCTLLQG